MKTEISFEKILFCFFGFIGIMIGFRVYYTGSHLFVFLAWNIFLAWIPFRLSYYLAADSKPLWKAYLVFGIWLLFFPNALYIITDLIHLQLETAVPKWYDAILLFSSSVVGLMMAFISLYRVEKMLEKKLTQKKITLAILTLLFLASFGVYLGRFLRWNSWDIVSNPAALLSTILQRIFFPFDHLRTWGITFLLTILFYLLYMSIKKLPGYINRATI